MSDLHFHGQTGEGTFSPVTILLVIGVGTLAFLAMLVLGAYAPDLRSGHNGGSHALSNAATGFSGIVELARETGRNPTIIRSEHEVRRDNEDVMVVTPDSGFTELNAILTARGSRTTLIILPKWSTIPDNLHPGWVRIQKLMPPADPEAILSPGVSLKLQRSRGHGEPLVRVDPAVPSQVDFAAPAVVQSMTGKLLVPIIRAPDGGTILGKIASRPWYLLSDPDLLNNHGMGSQRQAASALALLDFVNSTGATSIQFDVTANGLGRSRSPLKLAFDAPFLGVTLIIFIAMMLAAWQALMRFGPVRGRQRAIAFGKAALVENSAALVRKARRETHLGGRYVEVVRERAMALFGLAPSLDAETLGARLEALNPTRSFAATAEQVQRARTRDELLGAAQSLNQWLEEAR